MARPLKRVAEYFPHFATSGRTMFILESKYGNNGYAFWFKLLELLAITEGHYYRIGNPTDWEFLVAKTKISSSLAKEILSTLADVDAIDKELYEHEIIWSQNFVDNLSGLYNKRKVTAPEKPCIDSFRHGNTSDDVVSGDGNQQSKVKNSKVKESKVKNSIEYESATVQGLSNLWTNCGYGTLNTNTLDKLMADVEIFSLPWVEEAIERGNHYGKRSYAYVRTILTGWQTEGKGGSNEPGRKDKANTREERDWSTPIDLEGIDEEELFKGLI